jgi:prepilin-type N-terminal cleavage/methylation domain-containing protein
MRSWLHGELQGQGHRIGGRTLSKDCLHGFTVTELLVVIALIAVLTEFLLPILAGMREAGRRTVCLSHLRQIGQAHLLYLLDWDEHLPEWHMSGPPRPEPFGTLRFWTEYLQPYLRSPAILQDPSAAGRGAPSDGAILADYVLLTWGPGVLAGRTPSTFAGLAPRCLWAR